MCICLCLCVCIINDCVCIDIKVVCIQKECWFVYAVCERTFDKIKQFGAVWMDESVKNVTHSKKKNCCQSHAILQRG